VSRFYVSCFLQALNGLSMFYELLAYGDWSGPVGDGGAYPECHVAQYPLEMGKKKVCNHSLHGEPPQLLICYYVGLVWQYPRTSSG